MPIIVNFLDQIYLASLEQTQTCTSTTTSSTLVVSTSTNTYATSILTSTSLLSAATTSVKTIATYSVVGREAISHKGADTLIVSPAKVIAGPGAEIPITITIYFRHAQSCPHLTWKLELYPSEGIKVLSKSGSLENNFDYVMHVVIKVESSGELKVLYLYGKGCPYGSEEKVTVCVEMK